MVRTDDMTQETRFPLQLDNVFFTSLQFRRVPELPDPLQLNILTQVRVYGEQFPDRLQIDLKIETPDDQPLMLSVELVGLFSAVEGQPKPDPSILSDFVNEKALYMLWPYMVQVVRQITSQMGTNPVNIMTPYVFDFKPLEQVSEPIEEEEDSG